MNHDPDLVVWQAFETSAIVRAIERGARSMRAGVENSRAIAGGRAWLAAARLRPGHVIVSAALTHIVLLVTIARPSSWQWIVLPLIGIAIGAVLIASSRPARTEP